MYTKITPTIQTIDDRRTHTHTHTHTHTRTHRLCEYRYAFHHKDPGVHVLDRWLPATETLPVCPMPKAWMWRPVWWWNGDMGNVSSGHYDTDWWDRASKIDSDWNGRKKKRSRYGEATLYRSILLTSGDRLSTKTNHENKKFGRWTRSWHWICCLLVA